MKTIFTIFSAVIFSMGIVGSASAANTVTSADIVDFTIQAKDIAPGGIGPVKLKPNSINSSKIKDGSLITSKIADGAVTSVKIAPGAVTPAKINATGAANGDLLTADGVGSASWQPSGGGGVSYVRTVVVSPVLNAGLPDAVASGTALLAAMDGITTASATDPYLLKIEPGVYDLGAGSLTMKPYVDIEGSGEIATTITSTISSTTAGTVIGANNAELRFLTAQNAGGGFYTTAIYNNAASPRLTHVTAMASGGTNSLGVYNISSSPTMTNVTVTVPGGWVKYGVYNKSSSSPTMTNVTVTVSGQGENYAVLNQSSSSPTMTNVTVTASGGGANYGMSNHNSSPMMTNVTVTASGGGGAANYGMYNSTSSPTMTNVTVTASGGATNYGVFNAGGVPTTPIVIRHSVIKGTTNSIYNITASTVRVGASQLDGAVDPAGAGTFTCVGAYSATFVALTSACQ